MARHVELHSIPKLFLAKVIFQHAQKGLSFDVSDTVKGIVGLVFVDDGLQNGMGGRKAVLPHDAGFFSARIQPHLPVGVKMVGGFGAHPGRKSFIEPEIVPPGSSDQVAKPLVGHFVRHDAENILFGFQRTRFGIKQQEGLVVSDPAPVLHRTAKTTGNGDLVQFRKREFYAEVMIVIAKNFFGRLQRVARFLLLAFGGPDAHLDAIERIFD